ncbi:MAG: outer membrane protein assembly factor BamE [Pseudomonadota bacterium]
MRSKGASILTRLVAGGVIAAMLASCTPVIRLHGYAPIDEELADVREGQDTRGSVRRKIGRPSGSGIFTEDGWFYASSRVEHFAFFEPEVIDRRVVAIVFDERDIVQSVNTYGLEDGKIVDLETNTTPTFGRELTILEQAFGNLGVITDDLIDN